MRWEKQQQAMETSKSVGPMHVQRASTKLRDCGQESLCITAALTGTTAPRIRRHGGMEGSGAALRPKWVSLLHLTPPPSHPFSPALLRPGVQRQGAEGGESRG